MTVLFSCRMVVDGIDQEGTWAHIEKMLHRNGPFAHPDFEPGPDVSYILRLGQIDLDVS